MRCYFRVLFRRQGNYIYILELKVFPLVFIWTANKFPEGWAEEEIRCWDWGSVEDLLKDAKPEDPSDDDPTYEIYGLMKLESTKSWTDCGYEYDTECDIIESEARCLSKEDVEAFDPPPEDLAINPDRSSTPS
jgi:hypothetical protein